MKANVNCPVIPHPITVSAVMISDGNFNYILPHFCSECRTTYDFVQLGKLDEAVRFALTDEERQNQIEAFDAQDYDYLPAA